MAKPKQARRLDCRGPTCAGHCLRRSRRRRSAIAYVHYLLITGIGGTGVVTIGGVLGMAAHLEGKGVGIIDMAGLAQKGGAVYSHIRIANKPEDIHAIRIAAGGADLVLGGDIVVAGNKKVLAAVKHGATRMVINLAEFLPGDFTRNADFSLPTERLKRAIVSAAGRDRVSFIDATRLATALMGNSIAANMFMVGYAFQQGALPLAAGIDRESDRDEWRSRGDEPGGIPLGPSRRARYVRN
jgi:indolepyruvate ferredoxin oxidoreductase